MEPTLRAHLISLKTEYLAKVKVSESTVAQAACGDWRFFERIQNGSSFTAKTYDRALRWFSDRWPEGHVWPADIERPTPTPTTPATLAEATP